MSPEHVRTLRLMRVSAVGDAAAALDAAIARAGLPVIATCGRRPSHAHSDFGSECAHIAVMPIENDPKFVDAADAPPVWCPMRSVTP